MFETLKTLNIHPENVLVLGTVGWQEPESAIRQFGMQGEDENREFYKQLPSGWHGNVYNGDFTLSHIFGVCSSTSKSIIFIPCICSICIREFLFSVLKRFLARVFLTSLQRFTYGTESFKDEDYGAPADTPDVPHQIYKGMLSKQVRAVKSFSFGTSLIGVGMQPILYEVWLI